MTSSAASPIQKAPNQGVIERRSPLPPGRYWIYIDISEDGKWSQWVKASGGKVKVLVVEPQKQMASWLPAIFATRWDLDIIQSVVGEWILFDVLSPVAWVGLGYPTTVIDKTLHSSAEIMTAPAPKSDEELNPLREFYRELGTVGTLILWGGGAILLYKFYGLVRDLPELGSRRKGPSHA